jgi:hypothetical protein
LTLDNGTVVFGNVSSSGTGGIQTVLWNTSQYSNALRRGNVTVFWNDGSANQASNYTYTFLNVSSNTGLAGAFGDMCGNPGDYTFWGLIFVIVGLALGTMVGGMFGGGLAAFGIIAGVVACVIPLYAAIAGMLAAAGLYFGRRFF